MNVAFVSNWGCGVGMAMRLKAEGNDVLFWADSGSPKDGSLGRFKRVGEGILRVTHSWDYLFSWAREKARTGPTIMVFEGSGMGDRADMARRAGLYVIGSGKFCEKLEMDRLFGFKVAADAGCALPPYEDFATVSDAIAFAGTLGDTPTYWKTDKYLDSDATRGTNSGDELVTYLEGVRRHFGEHIPSIIQQKIDGVAISTSRWWNGRAFVGPYEGDLEHKKAFNDELGPATGCAFDAVWFYHDDEPPIAKALCWDQFAPVFLANEAPPGIYDINSVVDEDGTPHFLEWTPRFGWDSTATSFALLRGELGAFLWGLATGTANGPDVRDEIAYSVRLGVPPYPWEHWSPPIDHYKFRPLPISIDISDPIFHAYQVGIDEEAGPVAACADGLLGLAVMAGKRVGAMNEKLVEWVQEHKSGTPGLFCRTDGAKQIAKDAEKMNATDLKVPEGLLR